MKKKFFFYQVTDTYLSRNFHLKEVSCRQISRIKPLQNHWPLQYHFASGFLFGYFKSLTYPKFHLNCRCLKSWICISKGMGWSYFGTLKLFTFLCIFFSFSSLSQMGLMITVSGGGKQQGRKQVFLFLVHRNLSYQGKICWQRSVPKG